MATHSSFLAWKIHWAEEPGGLQSLGLHRVGHDLVTKNTHTHFQFWLWFWYLDSLSIHNAIIVDFSVELLT